MTWAFYGYLRYFIQSRPLFIPFRCSKGSISYQIHKTGDFAYIPTDKDIISQGYVTAWPFPATRKRSSGKITLAYYASIYWYFGYISRIMNN